MLIELPKGAVQPEVLITDIVAPRVYNETIAGAINNSHGFMKHLIERGVAIPESLDPTNPLAFAKGDQLKKQNAFFEQPEISSMADQWYAKLHYSGAKRILGFRAANHQAGFVSGYDDRKNKFASPRPVYTGELPATINTPGAIDAMQRILDIMYGESGIVLLAGPPMSILALYPDLAVSIRPRACTLVNDGVTIMPRKPKLQEDIAVMFDEDLEVTDPYPLREQREIWQLELSAELREPVKSYTQTERHFKDAVMRDIEKLPGTETPE